MFLHPFYSPHRDPPRCIAPTTTQHATPRHTTMHHTTTHHTTPLTTTQQKGFSYLRVLTTTFAATFEMAEESSLPLIPIPTINTFFPAQKEGSLYT